jgi:predicted RNA-binding protein with RPS1 domain
MCMIALCNNAREKNKVLSMKLSPHKRKKKKEKRKKKKEKPKIEFNALLQSCMAISK